MKIVVVFPTRTEAQFFSHPQVAVEFCGVGLTATAYQTSKLIDGYRADWLIMAGIAGVYPGSSYVVGDTVLVASEREADLGFFTPKGFTHLADLDLAMDFTVHSQLHCPYINSDMPLPIAHSNSLNAAMAPFASTQGVDIENMEGAAFFQVCLAEQQRFLEVRSISNQVKIGDDEWDFEGSIRQLTAGLHQVIDYLLSKEEQ
ncbi:purine phosphorylase [Chitinibacter bivalviorum]|uniref:Purine phosphorylase n=1 Tax=Chitinibacter bivalviorum TaxID=2739434 RepID=A0A7H9BK65_9NEIS|nr:purine phosphorylase [Chitinibacter bivalviorum]QLG89075.1 purine phosphorylase [Chitinibacter bivalviorum]